MFRFLEHLLARLRSRSALNMLRLLMFPLIFVATAASSPCLPWLVATDWDDTVKAGGHSLFGIKGVGRRVKGTYPGITTLMAELVLRPVVQAVRL